tara:strand:- start:927 stop:2255 length:1329 start_codon:yes stop_codon:yes gene_type:complete
MPLQKSKKKKKRVSKDGDVIQSVKQSVVVNVGADDKKKRRGRPRKKGAPKAPPKPPQFSVAPPPPNAGLVQQIFPPPAPPPPPPMGVGLRQDPRRLSLNEAVGFQQQQQMGHGQLNPPSEASQLNPSQVRQRRSDMMGTSEREQSMMRDLADLRRELNTMRGTPSASPIPADLRVEAVRAEVINDRTIPSAERFEVMEDLRDLLKRNEAQRMGGSPPPTPVQRDIGGVSRSLPSKTLNRKSTDGAFETPVQEKPPQTGFLAGEYNVYNDPDLPDVSIVKGRPSDPNKPRRVKKVRLVDRDTGELLNPDLHRDPVGDLPNPQQTRGRARRRTKAEMAEYRRQQAEAQSQVGRMDKPEPLVGLTEPAPSMLKRDPMTDASIREQIAQAKAQQGDIFGKGSESLSRVTSEENWGRLYEASVNAPDSSELMNKYVAFLETDDDDSE